MIRSALLKRVRVAAGWLVCGLLAFGQVFAAQDPPAEATGLRLKGKIHLLGSEVAPGTRKRLTWTSGAAIEGFASPTPVIVVNGKGAGPVLCLTGAVHGDELNGIEVARRVLDDIEAEELNGAVISVPIVNIQGFYRGTRYLPDRRDLNRHFPGNPHGSAATRMAHSFFTEVVRHCSALIDLHTGSLNRTNLPQVRADLRMPQIARMTQAFGATVVLQSAGDFGSLRRAAGEAGIPAVTFEMGEPMRVQPEQVEHGAKAIETLMYSLGMTHQRRYWGDPEPVYYASQWVRVDHGGILFSDVALGERVSEGELLGVVTDPISNRQYRVYAPASGRVLGMALNQVVLPGFAAYRIGTATSKAEAAQRTIQGAPEDPAEDVSPEDEEGSPRG
ncbi:succinylglutamate desuccinylase [Steroidobacter denitrificans]|uniref:Succinylglutamate desuccinylase n=1 Tax=Steroidobacter denitrificans TaxID=465721 RepID=A0A127F846_STEDE|nr:succinylglutamate desuccinylase [Steroidobacter denitrificans]